MKNFTKSRQEFADRPYRLPQVAADEDRRPGSVPGGIGPLCSYTGRMAGAVSAAPLTRGSPGRPSVHEWGRQAQDGVNLGTVASAQNSVRSPRRGTASNLDTQSRSRVRSKSVHAVEFSKTAAPPREGRSLRSAPRPDKPILGQTAEYSARIRSRGLDLLSRTGPAPGGRSAVDQDRTSASTVRSPVDLRRAQRRPRSPRAEHCVVTIPRAEHCGPSACRLRRGRCP